LGVFSERRLPRRRHPEMRKSINHLRYFGIFLATMPEWRCCTSSEPKP
jgi:hypothetical protein